LGKKNEIDQQQLILETPNIQKPPPYLIKVKSPRITLSGNVALTELEVKLIDTRVFQRLRTIKQLGMSHLVYPSANHNRFEHSLGTLYKADLMINKIRTNDHLEDHERDISYPDEQIIRLVALLHDVPFLPFGHTLEDEARIIDKHDEDEIRFNYFFKESDLGKVLKENLPESQLDKLFLILRTSSKDVEKLMDIAYISDIVKNTLCADLLDYLPRDGYYCDLTEKLSERFLDYICIRRYPEDTNIRRIIVKLDKKKKGIDEAYWPRSDLLSEMRDLLKFRFSLGQKVYYHHTKKKASCMISRAVQEVLGTNKLTINRLSMIGDEELLTFLEESGNKIAENLVSKIRTRNLYKKLIYRLKFKDVMPEYQNGLITDYHENASKRREMEDYLADYVGLNHGDVLIYCPSAAMQHKIPETLVTWQNGIKRLKDIGDRDDPITYKDIHLIIEQHHHLWTFEVFLTPDQVSTEHFRELQKLCRTLFEQETQENNRDDYLRDFYDAQVLKACSNNGLIHVNREIIVGEIMSNHRTNPKQTYRDIENYVINSYDEKKI
jgi:HD superfamily phosphohydrolases